MSTTATSEKRAYRFREFCEMFGVGKDAAYKAIRNGELIAYKRGKATVILAEDAERYVTSLPRLRLPSARTMRCSHRSSNGRGGKDGAI